MISDDIGVMEVICTLYIWESLMIGLQFQDLILSKKESPPRLL